MLLLHGNPHFWPQWPVLNKAACQSCTHFRLSGHKRRGNAPLLSSPTSYLCPPSGAPFLRAPRGTYSAASSTERHLRTLDSSNCAGPARWAHQEETQAAATGTARSPPQSSCFHLFDGLFKTCLSSSHPSLSAKNPEQFLCP